VSNTFTNNTLDQATQISNEKVWTFRRTGGLSTGANTRLNNLIKKATTPTVSSTTVIVQPNPSGKNGVPKELLSASAVQSPSLQQGRMFSEVSVSFTRDGSDANFGSARVWFTGYQGSSTPTLMASGTTSPITFLCESTKEIVVVSVQPVSPEGLTADLGFAISGLVALNGVVSAPPAPSIAQTLVATPTGYQFSFNYEAGLLADIIQGYNIYRNTSNTSSGATLIKNVPQPAQNTGVYTYQETVTNGTVYYYFVAAVNTTGLESLPTSAQSGQVIGGFVPPLTGTDGVSSTSTGHNLVFNGDFSVATTPTGVQSAGASAIRVRDNANGGGIQPSCNGWTRNFDAAANGEGVIYQIVTVAGAGLVGPYTLILQDRTGSTGDAFGAVSDAFSIRASTPYTLSANINPGYGGGGGIPTHANWYFRIYWYAIGATDFSRGSASLLSFNDVITASTASGPQAPSATFTSPATAGYARITFYHYYDGTLPSTVWNLAVSNVRCFAPVDPSNTGQVLALGSTPASLSSGFSYTSTTTSVTISWSGLTIYRADGSTTAVSNGSQLVTGLSATTSYRVYPYYDEPTGTLLFVTGGVGSPAICFTAGSNATSQSQNLQSRIPLTAGAGFTVTTPTSGSGGGSGGGSGLCLHENMLVESNRGVIQIIDTEIGDKVLGEQGWQTITYKKVGLAEIFISIKLTDGSKILCTPTHPFTMPEGSEQPMKRAQDLSLSDFLITTTGVGAIKSIEVVEMKARKVSVTVEPAHTFFAGKSSPTILTHNLQPS
jgi:hypothetical protein